MDNKLMVCDRQTSVKRYSGLYNGLLVPVSEERLLGQERLEHDIAYGTIIAKYRNGDTSISFSEYEDAVEELIATNIELAYKWATQFLSNKQDKRHVYTLNMACLDAMYALIKYVKNTYDPSKGFIVSTGARWFITRELQDNYSVMVFGVKSQHIPRTLSAINKYYAENPEGSIYDLSEQINVPISTIESVVNISLNPLSLNKQVESRGSYKGEISELQDILSEEDLMTPESEFTQKKIEEVTSVLTDFEKEALFSKYNIFGYDKEDFVKKHNLNTRSFRMLCKKIIDKVKENLI